MILQMTRQLSIAIEAACKLCHIHEAILAHLRARFDLPLGGVLLFDKEGEEKAVALADRRVTGLHDASVVLAFLDDPLCGR